MCDHFRNRKRKRQELIKETAAIEKAKLKAKLTEEKISATKQVASKAARVKKPLPTEQMKKGVAAPNISDGFPAAIGRCVTDCREKLGLTQLELAIKTGFHRSYMGDLERGTRNISVKNSSILGRSLNLKASELMKLIENVMSAP